MVSFFKDCKNPSDGAAFLFSLCTVCVQYTVIILPDREVILDALLSCDSCLLPMLIFPRSTEVPEGAEWGVHSTSACVSVLSGINRAYQQVCAKYVQMGEKYIQVHSGEEGDGL